MSRRLKLKYHTLPSSVKRAVVTGDITEGHLQAISAVIVTSQLSPWLTAEAAWTELAESVVRDRAKNGSKSVAATRTD